MARKRLPLIIISLALFTATSSFATCANEGLHTSGGGFVSSAGGRATLFQQNISGCFIYISHIYANLVQTGSSAGSATVVLYSDTGCSAVAYNLQQIGVAGTKGATGAWEYRSDGNGSIRTGSGGANVCIGFNAGVTGVIESVFWEGFFSGNIQ